MAQLAQLSHEASQVRMGAAARLSPSFSRCDDDVYYERRKLEGETEKGGLRRASVMMMFILYPLETRKLEEKTENMCAWSK